ncbi:MAG: glycoside hydrolase family 25 protein [Erysipelotrichaceae bacterium]
MFKNQKPSFNRDEALNKKTSFKLTNKTIIVLLSVALVISIIIFSFFYSRLNQKHQELSEKFRDLETEFIDLVENNIIIPSDDFMSSTNEYQTVIEFAQNYFSDKFVYRGYGGIKFVDLIEGLSLNKYNDADKMRNIDGRLYYRDQSQNFTSSLGIDVSHHQKEIDWQIVKEDGIDWAMIRLGYRGYMSGEIHLDEQYLNNIMAVNEHNLASGVYFYSAATSTLEAIEEAEFVLDNIEEYEINLPVAFDMEDIGGEQSRTHALSVEEKTEITKAFCDTIIENGYKCLVYGNSKWLMERLNFEEIAEYGIWHAQYSYYNFPYELLMYQYTSSASVAGVAGNVDLNVGFFNLDEDGEMIYD